MRYAAIVAIVSMVKGNAEKFTVSCQYSISILYYKIHLATLPRILTRGVLNPSNPVFSEDTISSKINTLLGVLKEKVLTTDDKAIIVSQWSSFLQLIAHHLEKERILFKQLDGTVPVTKRMHMVDRFNNPKYKIKVLLVSLTAGGVGLNLIGANHLFILDIHWNPQLENQVEDIIYRVGQKKDAHVYKLMVADTIEK
ncbi:hypothetical protein JTB14_033393 [Gonioctena quinquepunctata]|nr:hypothetical protein JTB14_033393 [Gonioctena quinquepunctata]